MLLSVIIPVFNGETFILRSINSIYSSLGSLDERQYEIIVVDDCSTDKTRDIILQEIQNHINLHLLCLSRNSRQGAARNKGISEAKGEYICFLDADDEIGVGLYEALQYAIEKKSDMLLGKICFEDPATHHLIQSSDKIPDKIILFGKDFCNRFYNMGNSSGYFCSYLYKTSFLKSLDTSFVEGRSHEDADWCEKHLWGAESVGYIDQPIYKYYTTPGSTMHSFSAQGDSDKILMCYRRLVFISPLGACPFTHTVKAHCMAWISAVFSFRHMSRHSAKSCRSVFTGIDSEVFRFLRKFKWYGFARISIFHPYFTTFIIAITHPFTQLCRFFYRNGKKS